MSTHRKFWVTATACAIGPWMATAQWDPAIGQWGKTDSRDIRVMTWNVEDGVCRTNDKVEGFNDWCALSRILASMKPDIIVMQECGDNAGNGTGSGVDTDAQLLSTLNMLVSGGTDTFNGNASITSYVKKYAPTFDLPYVYVSVQTDNFNRNLIASRFPLGDLTGDTQSAISNYSMIPDLYAPGGSAGIRGFIWAELQLPDDVYAGDIVVGTAHFKSGSATSDKTDRLNASKNAAYYIDYIFNGGGLGSPDPRDKIFDFPQTTQLLAATTPAVWAGDFNEDEDTNARDGPVLWMTRAQNAAGDGTDRDRSNSTYDDARDVFTNNRSTQSSSKLDYMCWQDSIPGFSMRRSFVFNSSNCSGTRMPVELAGFPGATAASSIASDHRPVIIDFIMPFAVAAPGEFTLTSPSDGAVNQPLAPTFTWAASSNAAAYAIEIDDDPTFASVEYVAGGIITTSHTPPPGTLDECVAYTWRVTASNASGSRIAGPSSFNTVFPSDFNQDGFVSGDDFDAFVIAFEAGDPGADFNDDEFITGDDFDAYVEAFGAGC